MSIESNKTIIRRLFNEILNRQNPSAINEIIAEDYSEQDPVEGQTQGRAGVEERLEIIFKAFPDAKYDLTEMIGEENKVAARWEMKGTQKGIFMNIQPAEKSIVMKGIDIYYFSNGMIVSHCNEIDMPEVLNMLKK
jgi:steroid delta-isomerase-like uncharacterized protein